MTERINFSSDAPWESVAGYSRAVLVGKTIEVAGTTAVDSHGQIVLQEMLVRILNSFLKKSIKS